jgi:hypothetical protein
MRNRNAKKIPDLNAEITTNLLIQQGQLHGSQKASSRWAGPVESHPPSGEWRGRAVQLAGTPAEGGGGYRGPIET